MFKRMLVASVVVLALGACGTTTTDSSNGAAPGTKSVGTCTSTDSDGSKICVEYFLPTAVAETYAGMYQSECQQGGTTEHPSTWAASCASGYAGTCKYGATAESGAVMIWHYYTTNATVLQAMGQGCTGAGATWTTP